jgi:hypothetical protein
LQKLDFTRRSAEARGTARSLVKLMARRGT